MKEIRLVVIALLLTLLAPIRTIGAPVSIAQQAFLKASNIGTGDEFGIRVAVSGDTMVVGSRYESSNATGVNGDQSDNSAV